MLKVFNNVDDASYWFRIVFYRGCVFFLSLFAYPKRKVDRRSDNEFQKYSKQ